MNDAAVASATALAGVLSPIIVQVSKRWIAPEWRAIYAGAVAVLLAVVGLALTGGLHGTTIPVAIAAVVGVSQATYTVVSKIVDETKAVLKADAARRARPAPIEH